ncbi:hypothetical protein NM688_g6414 [Phlebia brevispora]|uniref:Uncharacterized protein n=1 Tax=Phlebia brevispora TaxID=194682 RepID=A0ACC1SG82_9APHY|nr:hypothetical protein NM688_g6414 [Phlebia brevispora]
MCLSDTPSDQPPPVPVPPEVLAHVVDVHCHPTDSPISPALMDTLHVRLCAMATRGSDQALLFLHVGCRTSACLLLSASRWTSTSSTHAALCAIGYHPWFAHWIAVKPFASKEEHYRSLFLDPSSKPERIEAFERLLPGLPEPTLLSDVLTGLRENLSAFPNAMLGEVGLDRACRIPYGPPSAPPYALDETRRELSPFTIPLPHQLAILEAQLDLAVGLRRNVSVHSVKCQQATVELLDRSRSRHGDAWNTISIDMHSCGLSAQTWKDLEKKHSNIFLSLSVVINSRSPAHRDLIATCSSNRILVESDYHDPAYSTSETWKMLQMVAEVKGWTLEDTWEDDVLPEQWGAVRRVEENWRLFEKGDHRPIRKKDKRKLLLEDWESDEEDKKPPEVEECGQTSPQFVSFMLGDVGDIGSALLAWEGGEDFSDINAVVQDIQGVVHGYRGVFLDVFPTVRPRFTTPFCVSWTMRPKDIRADRPRVRCK